MSQLALVGVVIGALVAGTSVASAQAPDIKRGKSLFENKGCSGCHSIGKGRRAGPDLKDVTDRRSKEWLHAWLANTDSMLQSDTTAQRLLKEANGIKMINPHLSNAAEVDDILAYITQESKK